MLLLVELVVFGISFLLGLLSANVAIAFQNPVLIEGKKFVDALSKAFHRETVSPLDDAFDTDATRCVIRGSQTCAREDHFLFEVHAIREESIDRDHASAWQATCRPAGLMR